MVRSEIFTQARQGNPEAIAALMNHSLQAKQIAVRVSIKDEAMMAIATGQTPPNRDFMVAFVCRGLRKLEAERIQKVTIVAYVQGGTTPLWRETVQLAPAAVSHRNGRSRAPFPPPPPTQLPASQPRPKLPPVGRSPRRRQAPRTWVDRLRTFGGFVLFSAIVALSVALAALVKVFTTLLAENAIYSIQFLGDLMRGIEIAEVFNLLVFAILGLGMGLATAFVPRQFGIRLNAVLIIILLPLLLSVGPFVRYDNWINEFATNEAIPLEESKTYTDNYLLRRIDRSGLLGFYLHTAKYPGLPVYIAQLDEADPLESQAVAQVERSVGVTSEDLSWWFTVCMWGIRSFYYLVSAVTVIGHFGQGIGLGDRIARRYSEEAEEG